jgi:ribosomal protein L12E/L44/L45/RPP1/RPP2
MRNGKLFVFGVAACAMLALAVVASAGETVVTLEKGCGKVISRVGNTVAIHLDGENKAHVFKGVPENVVFHTQGTKVTIDNLEPGDFVCVAELQHMSTGAIVTVEHHEVEETVKKAAMTAPAPAPKPAPAAAPAPKAAPKPVALPHTASSLPLTGLAGLALLALSLGIAVLRRF